MAHNIYDKNIKALIIEDEEVAREKLLMMMNKFADCSFSETGEGGLRSFSESLSSGNYFDIVLLDISLPDVNGKMVLKRIHELEQEQAVPVENKTKVVMVTASSSEEDLFGSIQNRCDDYLLKPVTEEILKDKLKAVGV